MTENEKAINNIIMQEIGLDIGPAQKIYDQDTGMAIQLNGLDLVAPGQYRDRRTVEFDPYNNRKMMDQLFSHFIKKYEDETDIDLVAFYTMEDDTPDKSRLACSMSDNNKIVSGKYYRDALKYTDIIIQLNGGDPSELEEYDSPIEKQTVKKVAR